MNNKFIFNFTIVIFVLSTSFSFAADLSGKVSPQGLRSADNILVYLTKTPYYALTDKKGSFKIDITDLDTGKYHLKTWHEKLKNGRIALDLTHAESKAMTIKLKRGAPGVLYK